MSRGLAAVAGGILTGYMAGKKNLVDEEERKAREEERQWRREDREEKQALKGKIKAIAEMGVTETGAMQNTQTADQDYYGSDGTAAGPATGVETTRAPGFALNGKTFDTRPTDDQVAGERRAATVAALGAVDPERAMQYEAGAMALDKGRDDADHRRKLKDVDTTLRAWGEKNVKKDGDGNPIMSDDLMVNLGKMRVLKLSQHGLYDEAIKTAQDSMQYATRKIQAEEVERKSAVRDAVAAAGMGDYKKAIEVYNKFVPDGSQAVDVTPAKDGSFNVKRISAVDGAALPAGKFKNLDHFVSSLNGLADSNALSGYIERTFKTDIESRRLGLEGGRLKVAQDAETRAKGKDEKAEKLSEEGLKALGDMDLAEQSGNEKEYKAARNRAIRAGIKLEKPEGSKPDVKVGSMGDITVSQPTGKGGVQVTNYGPDMKPKGTVNVAAPGQSTAPKTGEERVVQAGPNKGKAVVWDGKGWALK